MTSELEADLLSASQPLRIPGSGAERVITSVSVDQLSAKHCISRAELEAQAIELGVAPLHYLRNMGEFGAAGQLRLLRSGVALVGRGPVLKRALEQIAKRGVGRLLILIPSGAAGPGQAFATESLLLERAVRDACLSSSCESRPVRLRGDNPAEPVRGMHAVGACLTSSMDEQLLQFACRIARIPLVLAGVEGSRGQATTITPGDPGTALVYRPDHPHLPSERESAAIDARAALMAGTWMADQILNLLLDREPLLRGRLLYADLERQDMGEYPLDRQGGS
jgi:molybdopterin/thiamine biosynthesis adenylyltransferase